MKTITLKSKFKINSELDLRQLSEIDFEKPMNYLLSIKALFERKEIRLKDLFEVKCKNNNLVHNELIINGLNKNCHHVGSHWSKGSLIINSNVGSFLGANMVGGKIIINGSADNYVGSQMKNGSIFVLANTSDFVGAPPPGCKMGMSGGEIIIKGRTKNYLGLNMRRGIIFIGGKSGDYCCNNMIAGTVILKKGFGKNLAVGMKRGTIISGKEKFSNTFFKRSGEHPESFFGLLNKYFSDHFNISLFRKKTKFIRFCRDLALDSKGELYIEK